MDEALRQVEREVAGPDPEVSLLKQRLRAGDLTQEQLALAAALGFGTAGQLASLAPWSLEDFLAKTPLTRSSARSWVKKGCPGLGTEPSDPLAVLRWRLDSAKTPSSRSSARRFQASVIAALSREAALRCAAAALRPIVEDRKLRFRSFAPRLTLCLRLVSGRIDPAEFQASRSELEPGHATLGFGANPIGEHLHAALRGLEPTETDPTESLRLASTIGEAHDALLKFSKLEGRKDGDARFEDLLQTEVLPYGLGLRDPLAEGLSNDENPAGSP